MKRSPIPVPRLLAGCLHLLVAALLALTAARAVVTGAPGARAVVATALAVAAGYALGPALPAVRRRPAAAGLWLAGVLLGWLALLCLTPDGIWLAFPLFFVQLHLLPRRWGVAAVVSTTVAAVAGFAWHRGGLSAGTALGPALGAAVAVAVVLGYQALYRESERRRRLIAELTAARTDLAAADRAAGVLAERERLAREIHDTLAQGLSSIQLLLLAAERELGRPAGPPAAPGDTAATGTRPGVEATAGEPRPEPPARPGVALQHIQRARRAALDGLAEARRFVRDWTPPDLEAGGLLPALERLCAQVADSSGLTVLCHVSGTPTQLPAPHETALLRIAQSALANTVQHAEATRAELTLSYMGTEVALDVVDDGRGFAPQALAPPGDGPGEGGFGLATMRARARALHGVLAVESAPGEGTAVAVTLPCAPAETAAGSGAPAAPTGASR